MEQTYWETTVRLGSGKIRPHVLRTPNVRYSAHNFVTFSLPATEFIHSAQICSDFLKMRFSESYVYWTVHHLDSWVKRDQLDVTCFIISLFNVEHVSDVNTSILRSLRLICWVISEVVLIWFDVYWCYVVVWLWWCGIRMQVEPAYGYRTTPAKPQHNTNTHRTRSIQPMK